MSAADASQVKRKREEIAMVFTILLIGLGLIIALDGLILLDRERFDRKPRMQYRAATLIGVAIVAASITGII